ncbi:class I ribonucleotide reductase maintenance protein YfaE [Aliidiomarina sanyensis]|uniref:(Fe-S)-binding protein n=1 Tax=Aliidiomarina sanyensis TaxID=1249555 RepID=A0A432WS25_9GAMM|nr:class I ribonucleotide reductase maintenance protein YfaE [Aliidiomarina sanyensis]RUO36572.1 (Fe-S)-binding protein [Aliidiomarina sanyensis]
MSCFRIVINQQITTEVEADAPASLLETMEATGLETRYHCRNGFCGACRTKLISGTVEYLADPLAYVRPGDILPCVCRATSDLELEHT